MKINVQTIPHDQQRYPTTGDWWFDENGDLQIRVSELGNKYYEFLVGYHEIAEAMLCEYRGIKEKDVSDFDMLYEKESRDGEPGDASDAPYQNEHNVATAVERTMCAAFGLRWEHYDQACFDLYPDDKKGVS